MPTIATRDGDLSDAYRIAQRAMADLKTAVYLIVSYSGKQGLRNADIGRALGIYTGHVQHEGHISRTILEIMQSEGVVYQDPDSKRWRLRPHVEDAAVHESNFEGS